MTKQTVIGSGLIGIAVFMFISGVGDQLAHLQNFDGVTLAQALGTILKDGSQIVLGVMGGTLLPGVGSASQDIRSSTVTVQQTETGKSSEGDK